MNIYGLEHLIKDLLERNLKLEFKGELALSGVTSTGFVPTGLGVSSSSGWVSTCYSGNV